MAKGQLTLQHTYNEPGAVFTGSFPDMGLKKLFTKSNLNISSYGYNDTGLPVFIDNYTPGGFTFPGSIFNDVTRRFSFIGPFSGNGIESHSYDIGGFISYVSALPPELSSHRQIAIDTVDRVAFFSDSYGSPDSIVSANYGDITPTFIKRIVLVVGGQATWGLKVDPTDKILFCPVDSAIETVKYTAIGGMTPVDSKSPVGNIRYIAINTLDKFIVLGAVTGGLYSFKYDSAGNLTLVGNFQQAGYKYNNLVLSEVDNMVFVKAENISLGTYHIHVFETNSNGELTFLYENNEASFGGYSAEMSLDTNLKVLFDTQGNDNIYSFLYEASDPTPPPAPASTECRATPIIRHLLPRAKAWSITIDKRLRQFFHGLGCGLSDPINFADLIYLDIFPDTTREIELWENQFGIIDNGTYTEAERRTRLNAAWKLHKINTREQIEEALQNAGFDVYVHEWWVPGTEPPVGVHAAATPRNPNQYIFGNRVDCGEALAACGEALAACGETLSGSIGYTLVNKITTLVRDILPGCGEALAACGEEIAVCGAYITINEIPKVYPIPDNYIYWPYFIYIGGETFPDFANVDSDRREEFENLCLKICPTQHWLGMLITYI